MLVNLTPNEVEISRRKEISITHNFHYVPQCDESLLVDVGFYRCNFDFNFSDDEFIEKLVNVNDCLVDSYIQSYGVSDNIEQIFEFYKEQIEDPENKYVIYVTPVFQDPENKGKGGGWRWHKWGKYIGKLDSKHEYLDDEDFGEDFKYILCFHIRKVKN